jgi:hypothetical protein
MMLVMAGSQRGGHSIAAQLRRGNERVPAAFATQLNAGSRQFHLSLRNRHE